MKVTLIVIVTFLIGVYGQDRSFLCDFEDAVQPFCGMNVGGTNPNLLVRRGDATPSEQTGPNAPQSGRNYVHLEASGTQSTDYVELTRSNLALNSGCLRFYYHMFDGGSGDVNSMRVDVNDGRTWTSVFQQQGNQGDQWRLFSGDVGVVRSLRFTLYSNGQYRGDIGLDNISLVSGTCASPGQQQAPPPAPRPVNPPINPPPVNPRPPPNQPPPPSSAGSSCALPPRKESTKEPRKGNGMMGMSDKLPWFLSMMIHPGMLDDPSMWQMMGNDDKTEKEDKFSWARCEKFMMPFTVALVAGQNSTYGRVEVYYNGTWGTVCGDRFTEKEAKAVCKSAGFYGGKLMTNVPQFMKLRGDDPRRIWLDGVRCYEGTRLQECGRNEWGVTDCNHDNDVFVMCDMAPEYCKRMDMEMNDTDVAESCMMDSMDNTRSRDYGSHGRNNGRGNNDWGNNDWDLREMLGSMMGNRRESEDKQKEEMKMKLKCMKSSPFALALLDGPSPSMGRVEVYLNETWGTVCNDDFGEKEAEAVCRTMGFFGGKVWRNPPQSAKLNRNDQRRIWLDGLRCGEDASLRECCRNEWGVNDCTHDQDVFVMCETLPKECKKMKEERQKRQCGKCGRRDGMERDGMEWGGDDMRNRGREMGVGRDRDMGGRRDDWGMRDMEWGSGMDNRGMSGMRNRGGIRDWGNDMGDWGSGMRSGRGGMRDRGSDMGDWGSGMRSSRGGLRDWGSDMGDWGSGMRSSRGGLRDWGSDMGDWGSGMRSGRGGMRSGRGSNDLDLEDLLMALMSSGMSRDGMNRDGMGMGNRKENKGNMLSWDN